jgi:hypothetical protein
MTVVLFDKKLPPIEKENFTEANAYIVHDAPGYQIDYSPVLATDPALQDDDCQNYGMPWAAIVICVKQLGDGFIGGRRYQTQADFSVEPLSEGSCRQSVVFKLHGLDQRHLVHVQSHNNEAPSQHGFRQT